VQPITARNLLMHLPWLQGCKQIGGTIWDQLLSQELILLIEFTKGAELPWLSSLMTFLLYAPFFLRITLGDEINWLTQGQLKHLLILSLA
jgi:hypothetical protein